MILETHPINEPLSKLVESIFYYKDFMPEHHIERVVPTGNMFFLFELDDIPRHTFDPVRLEPNATFLKAWVSGMHQNYLSISAHPHSEMLVVQCKTTGAFPFVHKPLEQLAEKVLPADNVFGNEVLIVRNEIKAKNSFAEKFQIIEQWLLQRMDKSMLPPDELVSIAEKLRAQPFSAHQHILKQYSKSQKTLIQQFKKYCGLTPKTLHRIFRFNKLLEIIKEKNEIKWSHIAYETGFSDQAHFIKDFQGFCGFNPTTYIRNEYNKQIPNFFPIDKKARKG